MSGGRYKQRAATITAVPVEPVLKSAVAMPIVVPEVTLEELVGSPEATEMSLKELLAEQQRLLRALGAARELIGQRGLAAHRQTVDEFTTSGRDTTEAYWNTDFEIRRREILDVDAEYRASLQVQQDADARFKELKQAIKEAREVEGQRFKANAATLREPYIGKVVKLDGKFADISDPDNPFALDPAFSWETSKAAHLEKQKWNYATVSKSGKVIKAKTKIGLAALARTVSQTEQLMAEVNVDERCTHFYEQRGKLRTAGKCSFLVQGGFMAAFTGERKELLPPVIALSSDQEEAERVYVAIHELAHLNGGDDHPPHGDRYCGRFGEYLGVYLSEPNAPYKDEVKDRLASDNYSPPKVKAWAMDGTGVRVVDEGAKTVVVVSPQQKQQFDEKDLWTDFHYRLAD